MGEGYFMKVLTIKAVNHFLQFTLFNMENESVLVAGSFERIGLDGGKYTIHCDLREERIVEELQIESYHDAVTVLLDKLIALNIVQSTDEIERIGYSILFGKDYSDRVFLTEEVLEKLEEFSWMDSMKETLEVIHAFQEVLPNKDMVGVFETAFYQGMSEESYLYAVPYSWYQNYGIRKYGFQGISHQYVLGELEKKLGKNDTKVISCYLENESNVVAIQDGKCIDTSSGFTPLVGPLMGTRSGDIDPSIIPFVMEKEGKNVGEVLDDLNRRSGLLGISENTGDMKDILALCGEGNEKALLAKNQYIRSVVDYIAKYYVLLGGVDILVFSGSVGEKLTAIRREICEKLSFLGVKIDLDQNQVDGQTTIISTDDSEMLVCVVPTNEELMIARETVK